MSYEISEFPSDEDFWRIDWMGKIRPNPDVKSEPSIEIPLTKLSPGYLDPLAKASLTDEQQVIHIGLGQTALLRAGSVWQQQQLHANAIPDKNKHLTFTIDTSQEQRHVFNAILTKNGDRFPVIPKQYYPVGRNYPTVIDSPVAVFPSTENDIDFIIFPRFELLRFYYCPTTTLAQCVWHNSIDLAINQEKSDLLEGDDVRIYLRKNLLDREAYVLARWFISADMRREVNSFHNKRVAMASNQSPRLPHAIHPDIGFPFSGKTTLKTLGKRIKLLHKSETGRQIWGFLVLNILHCSYPMPFKDIVVDRENRNLKGKNKDDDDLKTSAWPRRIYEDPDQDDPENKTKTLASDEEPRKDSRRITIEIYEQQFDLSNHKLIKEEVEVQKYKSAKILKSGEEIAEQFGTGEGTYSDSETDQIEVKTNPDNNSEKQLVQLNSFVEALKWMRAQPNISSITTLALGSEHLLIDGETLYLLPARIKGLRSWHRINGSSSSRSRGIMIAEVKTSEGVFYLFEIERKSKNESYATRAMTCEHEIIHADRLKSFLFSVARHNGWPDADEPGFEKWIFEKVPHLNTETHEDFGQKILEKISSISNISANQ